MKYNKHDSYEEWLPAGFRILVKIRKLEITSSGGIVLTDSLRDKVEYSLGEGVVVAVGPTAYEAFEGEPWCKEGDQVRFRSFSGIEYTFLDEDGEEAMYRFINDDDIVGVKR